MNKDSKVEYFQKEVTPSDYSSKSSAVGAPVRTIPSENLFGGDNEIGILHQGSLYRLRITRGGKLILNK